MVSARAIRKEARPGRRCWDIARLQIDEGNLSKCSPSRKRQRCVAIFVQRLLPRWSIHSPDIPLIEVIGSAGQIAHPLEGGNSVFTNSSA
jgi:hypothetical protein